MDFIGTNRNIDGKSLLPLIKTNKKIHDKIFLIDGFCEKRTATRTKTKKTILSESGKCNICGAEHSSLKEVYDLKKDPEEWNNLSKKE